MDEETRKMLIAICDLVKRLAMESSVAGDPIDDRWKLVEIFDEAQRIIDEDLRR